MSALSTVILAGLLIGRFNGLEHFAVQTLWAGLPHFVCGLAVGSRHDNVWTPLEGSALPTFRAMFMFGWSCVDISGVLVGRLIHLQMMYWLLPPQNRA
jgi:hypothetical protein